jgi:alpha-L-arabinofuranosidase
MPFGAASVVTDQGRRTVADRLQTTTTRNPPKFIGMGVGATGAARTAAVTDTALSTEVETRATGTESIVTVTVTSDTYQIVGTMTATAARVVDEAGSFDASTVGNMATSFTFAVVNLANGDSIQFTIRLRAG